MNHVDPLCAFYKTVRTEYQAQSKLAEIVNSSIRKILGAAALCGETAVRKNALRS